MQEAWTLSLIHIYLHNQLLQSSKFPFYTAAYYKALPYIVELRNKGDKKDVSELENCFDALYGVMLLLSLIHISMYISLPVNC